MNGENRKSGQKAVGYVRVSGRGQVNGTGPDRQREAINAYATQSGLAVAKVYEEAYTGTEADRPVFTEMLHDLLTNGCRTIIVESLDRFARDLGVQLQLTALLASRGLVLVNASTGQDVTAAMQADPMMRAMVQIQGVFAELDKRLTVAKLRKARQRIRRQSGRCEGRRPFGTGPGEAATLARMKALDDGTRTAYAIAMEQGNSPWFHQKKQVIGGPIITLSWPAGPLRSGLQRTLISK